MIFRKLPVSDGGQRLPSRSPTHSSAQCRNLLDPDNNPLHCASDEPPLMLMVPCWGNYYLVAEGVITRGADEGSPPQRSSPRQH